MEETRVPGETTNLSQVTEQTTVYKMYHMNKVIHVVVRSHDDTDIYILSQALVHDVQFVCVGVQVQFVILEDINVHQQTNNDLIRTSIFYLFYVH